MNTGNPKYIIDTDIGPDCDDAAALALAMLYARQYGAEILAIMHCTSSPWGVGAVRAIADSYAMPDIEVGTLKAEGFLTGEAFELYNRTLALGIPAERRQAGDALKMYRKILSRQSDNGVVIIAIGPLRNIANLLRSGKDEYSELNGAALVRKKVSRLVLMAGDFTPNGNAVEWNIEMDIDAARFVAANWPSEMIYCGFEVGKKVVILRDTEPMAKTNPVRIAYNLHSGNLGRCSWAPCTVQWAMSEQRNLYTCSAAGIITLDAQGRTIYKPAHDGRHRYISLTDANVKSVVSSLENLLLNTDKCKHV